MSAQRHLVEGQAALGVRAPKRAHPVNDEAVVLDRRLEALFAAPWIRARVSPISRIEKKAPRTHTSCSE